MKARIGLGICVLIVVLVFLIARVLRFAAGMTRVVVLLVGLLVVLALWGASSRR